MLFRDRSEAGRQLAGRLSQYTNDRSVIVLGLPRLGTDRVIQVGYRLLNLITFLTAGEDEVRAWTVTKGAKAPEAAGKIHSDIERGFIRAEVTRYDDFMASGGSFAAAKEKGLFRLEGKEYVVQDGDVMHFRFNV